MTQRFARRGLLTLAALLCLPAAAVSAEIVALGASNTLGRGGTGGVDRPQAFPAQLEGMLRAQGCRARVANAGIAGDTTDGMLARMPRAIARDTKVVILQPGGNDRSGNRAINIAEIERQLSARGIKMVLLDRLNQIAGPYQLDDGIHYNAQGHVAFAAAVLPQVRATGVCG